MESSGFLRQHWQSAAGQRSFVVNGPTTWNSLLPTLRVPELSQNVFSYVHWRWTCSRPPGTAKDFLRDSGVEYKHTYVLTYLFRYRKTFRRAEWADHYISLQLSLSLTCICIKMQACREKIWYRGILGDVCVTVMSGRQASLLSRQSCTKAQIPLGSVPRNFLAHLLATSPTSS